MDMKKRTWLEDSMSANRMKRQQIDKLKKDNERLKEDLALETRQAKQASNMSASAQIAKLQDHGDYYARKIATEKRRVEEHDRQVRWKCQAVHLTEFTGLSWELCWFTIAIVLLWMLQFIFACSMYACIERCVEIWIR